MRGNECNIKKSKLKAKNWKQQEERGGGFKKKIEAGIKIIQIPHSEGSGSLNNILTHTLVSEIHQFTPVKPQTNKQGANTVFCQLLHCFKFSFITV